jgi:hypothetical protein
MDEFLEKNGFIVDFEMMTLCLSCIENEKCGLKKCHSNIKIKLKK